jgi:hypothetical protein
MMVSTTPACTHAWARQRQWSIAADAGRDRIRRRRQLNLVLLILGALAGAVAAVTAWPPVTTIAATIATLALTGAGAVQKRWLTGQELNRWAKARAASEAVKTEVYRYLAEVGPYAGPDRDTALVKALDDAQDPAQDLLVDLHTTTVTDNKPLPEVHDFNTYVEKRAAAQANWHRSRIGHHQKAASRIRAAELAATVIAAVLSALTATGVIDLAAWVGAATTIAAALAAHLAATRHDRIAGSYAATTEHLDRLIQRLPPNPDPAAATTFVDAVERVLTAQNQGWGSLISAPESGS